MRLPVARGAFRFALLLASLLQVYLRFLRLSLRHLGRVTRPQRAQWLHQSCSLIRTRLGIQLEVRGPVPTDGLIVSNHLSSFDILLYSAATECVFAAKAEVCNWPLFGALARFGGTIFVDRARRSATGNAVTEMEQALMGDVAVLLFPEGTSSSGATVLPFRSSLFEPAVAAQSTVTAAAIRYAAANADEAEVAYWGDKVFLPHLFRVLCLERLRACIDFTPPARYSNRKLAAAETWQRVAALREAAPSSSYHRPRVERETAIDAMA